MAILGIFKTKEERRIEREMQVKQGLSQMRRQVKMLEKSEVEYLEKARHVHKRGLDDQLPLLKSNVRRTIATRKNIERQIIAIETAIQMRAEAESINAFAKSLNAISSSISELFGATDMVKMQTNFEKAMLQAQSMQERTELFIESFTSDMTSADVARSNDEISDEALDRLIFAGEKSQDPLLEEINALEQSLKTTSK